MGSGPVSFGVENRTFYGQPGFATPIFEQEPALPTGATKEQGQDSSGNVNQAFTAPFGFLNMIGLRKDRKGGVLFTVVIIVAVIVFLKG